MLHVEGRPPQRLQPGCVLGVELLLRRDAVPLTVTTDPHFVTQLAVLSWAQYEGTVRRWAAGRVAALLPPELPAGAAARLQQALLQGCSYVQRQAGEALYVSGERVECVALMVQGQVLMAAPAEPTSLVTEGQLAKQLRMLLGNDAAGQVVPSELPRPVAPGGRARGGMKTASRGGASASQHNTESDFPPKPGSAGTDGADGQAHSTFSMSASGTPLSTPPEGARRTRMQSSSVEGSNVGAGGGGGADGDAAPTQIAAKSPRGGRMRFADDDGGAGEAPGEAPAALSARSGGGGSGGEAPAASKPRRKGGMRYADDVEEDGPPSSDAKAAAADDQQPAPQQPQQQRRRGSSSGSNDAPGGASFKVGRNSRRAAGGEQGVDLGADAKVLTADGGDGPAAGTTDQEALLGGELAPESVAARASRAARWSLGFSDEDPAAAAAAEDDGKAPQGGGAPQAAEAALAAAGGAEGGALGPEASVGYALAAEPSLAVQGGIPGLSTEPSLLVAMVSVADLPDLAPASASASNGGAGSSGRPAPAGQEKEEQGPSAGLEKIRRSLSQHVPSAPGSPAKGAKRNAGSPWARPTTPAADFDFGSTAQELGAVQQERRQPADPADEPNSPTIPASFRRSVSMPAPAVRAAARAALVGDAPAPGNEAPLPLSPDPASLPPGAAVTHGSDEHTASDGGGQQQQQQPTAQCDGEASAAALPRSSTPPRSLKAKISGSGGTPSCTSPPPGRSSACSSQPPSPGASGASTPIRPYHHYPSATDGARRKSDGAKKPPRPPPGLAKHSASESGEGEGEAHHNAIDARGGGKAPADAAAAGGGTEGVPARKPKSGMRFAGDDAEEANGGSSGLAEAAAAADEPARARPVRKGGMRFSDEDVPAPAAPKPAPAPADEGSGGGGRPAALRLQLGSGNGTAKAGSDSSGTARAGQTVVQGGYASALFGSGGGGGGGGGQPLANALAAQLKLHKHVLDGVYNEPVLLCPEALHSLQGNKRPKATHSAIALQRTEFVMVPVSLLHAALPEAAAQKLAASISAAQRRLQNHSSTHDAGGGNGMDSMSTSWPIAADRTRELLQVPPGQRQPWQLEALAAAFSHMPVFARLAWQERLRVFQDLQYKVLEPDSLLPLAKLQLREVDNGSPPLEQTPSVDGSGGNAQPQQQQGGGVDAGPSPGSPARVSSRPGSSDSAGAAGPAAPDDQDELHRRSSSAESTPSALRPAQPPPQESAEGGGDASICPDDDDRLAAEDAAAGTSPHRRSSSSSHTSAAPPSGGMQKGLVLGNQAPGPEGSRPASGGTEGGSSSSALTPCAPRISSGRSATPTPEHAGSDGGGVDGGIQSAGGEPASPPASADGNGGGGGGVVARVRELTGDAGDADGPKAGGAVGGGHHEVGTAQQQGNGSAISDNDGDAEAAEAAGGEGETPGDERRASASAVGLEARAEPEGGSVSSPATPSESPEGADGDGTAAAAAAMAQVTPADALEVLHPTASTEEGKEQRQQEPPPQQQASGAGIGQLPGAAGWRDADGMRYSGDLRNTLTSPGGSDLAAWDQAAAADLSLPGTPSTGVRPGTTAGEGAADASADGDVNSALFDPSAEEPLIPSLALLRQAHAANMAGEGRASNSGQRSLVGNAPPSRGSLAGNVGAGSCAGGERATPSCGTHATLPPLAAEPLDVEGTAKAAKSGLAIGSGVSAQGTASPSHSRSASPAPSAKQTGARALNASVPATAAAQRDAATTTRPPTVQMEATGQRLDDKLYVCLWGSLALEAVPLVEADAAPHGSDSGDGSGCGDDDCYSQQAQSTSAAGAIAFQDVAAGESFSAAALVDVFTGAPGAVSAAATASRPSSGLHQAGPAQNAGRAASAMLLSQLPAGESVLQARACSGGPPVEVLCMSKPMMELLVGGVGRSLPPSQLAPLASHVDWLAGVDVWALGAALVGRMKVEEHKQGAELLRSGEAAPAIFVVADGECVMRCPVVGLRDRRVGAAHAPLDLATLRYGSSCGELSLLGGRPLWYSLVVSSPTARVVSLDLPSVIAWFRGTSAPPGCWPAVIDMVSEVDVALYGRAVKQIAIQVLCGDFELNLFTTNMKAAIKRLMDTDGHELEAAVEAATVARGGAASSGLAAATAKARPVVLEGWNRVEAVAASVARPYAPNVPIFELTAKVRYETSQRLEQQYLTTMYSAAQLAIAENPRGTASSCYGASAEQRVAMPAPGAAAGRAGGLMHPAEVRTARQHDIRTVPRELQGAYVEIARAGWDTAFLPQEHLVAMMAAQVHVKDANKLQALATGGGVAGTGAAAAPAPPVPMPRPASEPARTSSGQVLCTVAKTRPASPSYGNAEDDDYIVVQRTGSKSPRPGSLLAPKLRIAVPALDDSRAVFLSPAPIVWDGSSAPWESPQGPRRLPAPLPMGSKLVRQQKQESVGSPISPGKVRANSARQNGSAPGQHQPQQQQEEEGVSSPRRGAEPPTPAAGAAPQYDGRTVDAPAAPGNSSSSALLGGVLKRNAVLAGGAGAAVAAGQHQAPGRAASRLGGAQAQHRQQAATAEELLQSAMVSEAAEGSSDVDGRSSAAGEAASTSFTGAGVPAAAIAAAAASRRSRIARPMSSAGSDGCRSAGSTVVDTPDRTFWVRDQLHDPKGLALSTMTDATARLISEQLMPSADDATAGLAAGAAVAAVAGMPGQGTGSVTANSLLAAGRRTVIPSGRTARLQPLDHRLGGKPSAGQGQQQQRVREEAGATAPSPGGDSGALAPPLAPPHLPALNAEELLAQDVLFVTLDVPVPPKLIPEFPAAAKRAAGAAAAVEAAARGAAAEAARWAAAEAASRLLAPKGDMHYLPKYLRSRQRKPLFKQSRRLAAVDGQGADSWTVPAYNSEEGFQEGFYDENSQIIYFD